MFAAIIVAIVLALAGYLFYKKYSLDFKRKRVIKHLSPYRENWSNTLMNSFILFDNFNNDEKEDFLDKVSIFLNEKKTSSEEYKSEQSILAAAHACLPLLNRKSNFYPLLTKDYKELDPIDWFSMHEKQFEFEFGKMPLRKFDGKFKQASMLFFYNPVDFNQSSSENYHILKTYYGVDPKRWS